MLVHWGFSDPHGLDSDWHTWRKQLYTESLGLTSLLSWQTWAKTGSLWWVWHVVDCSFGRQHIQEITKLTTSNDQSLISHWILLCFIDTVHRCCNTCQQMCYYMYFLSFLMTYAFSIQLTLTSVLRFALTVLVLPGSLYYYSYLRAVAMGYFPSAFYQ